MTLSTILPYTRWNFWAFCCKRSKRHLILSDVGKLILIFALTLEVLPRVVIDAWVDQSLSTQDELGWAATGMGFIARNIFLLKLSWKVLRDAHAVERNPAS